MNQEQIVSNGLPKPQDNDSREYLAILKEPIPLDEKLTAIYTKAMKTLNLFAYRRMPSPPPGYNESFMEYVSADKDEKAELWKGLCTEYGGYQKAMDTCRADNDSNLHFLRQMRDHFEKHQALDSVHRLQNVINDHEREKVYDRK